MNNKNGPKFVPLNISFFVVVASQAVEIGYLLLYEILSFTYRVTSNTCLTGWVVPEQALALKTRRDCSRIF